MLAANYDITIDRAAEYTFVLTIQNQAGTAVNIGSATFYADIRDLVGIPVPEGAEQFIYWASDFTVDDENGELIPIPRPTDDPDVPNTFWA